MTTTAATTATTTTTNNGNDNNNNNNNNDNDDNNYNEVDMTSRLPWWSLLLATILAGLLPAVKRSYAKDAQSSGAFYRLVTSDG